MLEQFRAIAAAMAPAPTDWQWLGRFSSQRMFGITEARARSYAETWGGEASRMDPAELLPARRIEGAR